MICFKAMLDIVWMWKIDLLYRHSGAISCDGYKVMIHLAMYMVNIWHTRPCHVCVHLGVHGLVNTDHLYALMPYVGGCVCVNKTNYDM